MNQSRKAKVSDDHTGRDGDDDSPRQQAKKKPRLEVPPALVVDLDADARRRISFDSGRSVIVGRLIAEGGFGSVFEARDAAVNSGQRNAVYALKRVDCGSDGNVQQSRIDECREEAEVHRKFEHGNLMPLLGMKFESEPTTPGAQHGGRMFGYMLFPYIPPSLDAEIMNRRLLEDIPESERRPFSEKEALSIFSGIADAVKTMHDAGMSHRDIKVENVLLKQCVDAPNGMPTPVLMDFGSTGPLTLPLLFRSNVLFVAEEAAKQTTLPYRAPELWDAKKLPHGPDEYLDYGRSDVWSLGCLLFAMLYGMSPFEVEWGISFFGDPAEGMIRMVECTHRKVLGSLPFPPDGSAADRRYGETLKDFIRYMLKRDRTERPSSTEVALRVSALLCEEC